MDVAILDRDYPCDYCGTEPRPKTKLKPLAMRVHRELVQADMVLHAVFIQLVL